MDPAYGDDLWAAGFSSGEEMEESSHSLDLLASLVEERESGVTVEGRSSERGSGVSEREKGGEGQSFGDALSKPDDVALMKAKMKSMEEELQKLRKQVSSASGSAQNKPRPQTQKPSPRSATPTTSSSIRRVKSSKANSRGSPSNEPVTRDRLVAKELVAQRQSDKEQNIVTDVFSGLRIKNPLVSSELMKKRMQGRRMIKVPNIATRLRGSDIEGDWVTVGVVVDKLPPRDTAKGDKYSIWKLSDLSSQTAVVLLFLFGKAHLEHWKRVQGSVVALLNPTIMPNRETGTVDSSSSRQLALSLDNPQKLMPLGISQDFTTCRATTKAGRKCSNFAKASDGGYCDYHVQGAYKKMRTSRMDCQGGYGPSATNLRGKLFKDSKTDVFYYGGRSFVAGTAERGSLGERGGAGRGSLGERGSVGERGGAGRGLLGERGGDENGEKQEKKLFARDIRESTAKEEEEEVAGVKRGRGLKTERGVSTADGTTIFQQMLTMERPGARHISQHLQKEEQRKTQAVKPAAEKSASDLLREESTKERKEVIGPQTGSNSSALSPFQPRLGRGMVPGSVVDLASRLNPTQLKSQQAAATKKKVKAAAVLREKQRLAGTGAAANDIVCRVEQNRAGDIGHQHLPPEGEDEGPCSKKRKVDMSEVDKILNAKSSHDWAAREVEWEREEQYFTLREKKENMEQKLSSIRQLSVHVSHCKQCDYVAERASDLCLKESHALSGYKAVKRWFECQDCKERACTYNSRYPTFSCRKCSSRAFKQTSLFHERKGPKVGGESLLLRGREEKYLQ